MALSGSINLTSAKAWAGKIVWSATQNIAENYSSVYVYAGMWKTDGYLTSSNSYTSGTITIDGDSYDLIGYQEFKDEVCIFEKTIRINHDSDGSKSFNISLSCKGQANTSLASATLSGSGTVTLDQIPRTSSFAATDAAIGSASTITIYRESSNLNHRIKVEFGSVIGYITNKGGFSNSPSTITGTSVAFTIPEDFYYAIPDSTRSTCILTLYTLSGDTVIGNEVTTYIEITTVSSRCNPILTMDVTHDNQATANLTGSDTAYIRGYSEARCYVSAEGRYGADIIDVWTDGEYYVEDDGIYIVSPVNSETITFYAKDSRGYVGSVSTPVTLVPYIVLTNSGSVGRPNPTDGSAYIQFQGQYFNDSFGAVENYLEMGYYIEYPDGSVDSQWTMVDPEIWGDSYSASVYLEGFDYTQTFKIHIGVADQLLFLEKTVTLKQGIPVFDWGRNDFQFHVPVYIQGNLIEVPQVLFTSEDYIGESGDVELSEEAYNFEYLEVFFNGTDGNSCNSLKLYNPEGRKVCLSVMNSDEMGSTYIRRSSYNISGRYIRYDNDGVVVFLDMFGFATYEEHSIRITRVVGYNRIASSSLRLASPVSDSVQNASEGGA